MELILDGVDFLAVQRLHGEQTIDKKAVAARCRYAPGRRVRAGNETQILKVGHDVAHGGR